jgi:hypothetical protein
MNYTIFYSWQSDLLNNMNRSFIGDALEKAAKTLSNNEDFSLEAVIDRDTYGMPGSPSIIESITGKIAKSDVFVCDVSIINNGAGGRPTPNPNVLFELGFASAILGWERIIMIQNTAFGGTDKLPFDLRGRRILSYHLDEAIEQKAEEKQKLKQKLIDILGKALEYYANVYEVKEKITWWGDWKMESKVKARGGKLHISRVASDSFFFRIQIFDGARTGEVEGKAQILTPHSAFARIKADEDKNCEIIFRRKLEGDSWQIEVEQGQHCNTFHGHNTYFSGIYQHDAELVVNRRFLDEIDLNEIERLTGPHLLTFLSNFQRVHSEVNEYGHTIVTTAVKGLHTIMESVVVTDRYGSLWCACLDPGTNVIRYFSNSTAECEPVREWMKQFPEKEIIVNDASIPEDR